MPGLRRHLVLLGLPLLLVCLCGCKNEPLPQGTTTPSATPAPSDEEQKKLLEDILRFQRDTGSTLESLAAEIARRKALESQARGPSPLVRDLAVARSLLVAARRAVQSEDRDSALWALRRLEAVVCVMQGETPASQIHVQLERAVLALQGSGAGVEADVASGAVLAALDVALEAPDAALVPDVARKLEKTKQQVDKGQYKEALKALEELIGTVTAHDSAKRLAFAAAGVRGARQALEREAWLVVLAELDQLSDLFNQFSTTLKAAPPAPEESSKEGQETPPAEATNEVAQPEGGQTPRTEKPAAASEGSAAGATGPAAAKAPRGGP